MATIDDRPITLTVPPGSKFIPETRDDQGRTYLLLSLTEEMNEQLEQLALKTSEGVKADVIRKALGLFKLAVDAKDEGKRVGIADADQELETEFVGL
ncbi:MAG: DNA-binding protein [Isosphaeraceae bacterium]